MLLFDYCNKPSVFALTAFVIGVLIVLHRFIIISSIGRKNKPTAMNRVSFMLRQAVNVEGIRYGLKSLLAPSVFIPNMEVRAVSDLSLDHLVGLGVRAIVFDKDNTLTVPFENQFPDHIARWMADCRQVF